MQAMDCVMEQFTVKRYTRCYELKGCFCVLQCSENSAQMLYQISQKPLHYWQAYPLKSNENHETLMDIDLHCHKAMYDE